MSGGSRSSNIKASFYCDEAGNTGPDYMHRDQPVYVLAGVLVPSAKRLLLRKALKELRAEYDEAFNKPAIPELKSMHLLKTPTGRRLLKEFAHGIMDSGLLPVFVIAEKRFSAAGKLIETFLDPDSNPAAEWLGTADNVARRELANQISERLPTDLLEEFVRAYRQPSVDDFRHVLERCIDAAHAMADRQIEATFRTALASADKIVAAELVSDDQPLRRAVNISLNVPVFHMLLHIVDDAMSVMGRGELVHDRTSQFEPGLRFWFDVLSRIPPFRAEGILREGPLRMGIGHVTKLRLSSAEHHQELLAADYLAGIVNEFGRRAARNEPIACPHLQDAQAMLMPLLLTHFAGYIASPTFVSRVFGDAGRHMEAFRRIAASTKKKNGGSGSASDQ